MSLNIQKLRGLNISEEKVTKIIKLHKEALKDYIPKSRFDEVNERMKIAESNIKKQEESLKEYKHWIKTNAQMISHFLMVDLEAYNGYNSK
jgi:DNA-binding transcriptional regulator GbsR (MarR family)